MASEQAQLCFTSPPYANQRSYTTGGIDDWDALMRGVFAQLPLSTDGQVLVTGQTFEEVTEERLNTEEIAA